MRKKVIICIVVIVLVIVAISVIINRNNEKKYQYEVEKLGKPNYFLYCTNNKYGVIDGSGNVIIDANYDIVEMPNPTKDIFICKSNYNESKEEYKVEVFNKEKKTILYQYYIVEAIPLNEVENNGFYEKSVLRYKSNGLYGLIDLSGKKITEAKYESIEGFEFNEGLMLVKKSGKLGIINMNGATIVDESYDTISSDRYYDESGYKNSGYITGIRTDNGMRYGYIDSSRKMLLKNEYNDIYRIEEKKDSVYLVAFKDGKAGIYDKNKNILQHDYEDIEYNSKNDALVLQKESKQGVARFDGSIIVPLEYDNILFAGSYINAKKDDTVDIYDADGNKEQSEEYISKQDFCEGKYAIVSTKDDEFKIIVNTSGKTISDGYSYVQYLFDNYFIVQKRKKFGVIDDSGNSVLECKYEVIQPTLEYGIIQLLSANGNIEILNKKFEQLVSPSKISIETFENYLKITNDFGDTFIDKNGTIIEKPSDGEVDYPDYIGEYSKVDLGYGSPYYVK